MKRKKNNDLGRNAELEEKRWDHHENRLSPVENLRGYRNYCSRCHAFGTGACPSCSRDFPRRIALRHGTHDLTEHSIFLSAGLLTVAALNFYSEGDKWLNRTFLHGDVARTHAHMGHRRFASPVSLYFSG